MTAVLDRHTSEKLAADIGKSPTAKFHYGIDRSSRHRAAVMITSIRRLGSPRLATPIVARDGRSSSGIHSSQALFISSFCDMSLKYILAARIFVLSEPSSARNLSSLA